MTEIQQDESSRFHLETFETQILPSWIDYNEHMNDSAYAIALTEANEEFLNFANLGSNYRLATGCTMYTVEAHIYYLAEVHQSDLLHARSCIDELGTKKLRLKTELMRLDGKIAARSEFLYLHFNQNESSVTAFPDAVFSSLSTLTSK